MNRLDEIFAASRTAPFDRYLITGYRDAQTHQAFIRFMTELQENRAPVNMRNDTALSALWRALGSSAVVGGDRGMEAHSPGICLLASTWST